MEEKNNSQNRDLISAQSGEPSKKRFEIHIVCGYPFKEADQMEKIKKIIEDELQRWPNKNEIAKLAQRMKFPEPKTRSIVNLLRQQEGFYQGRRHFLKEMLTNSVLNPDSEYTVN